MRVLDAFGMSMSAIARSNEPSRRPLVPFSPPEMSGGPNEVEGDQWLGLVISKSRRDKRCVDYTGARLGRNTMLCNTNIANGE